MINNKTIIDLLSKPYKLLIVQTILEKGQCTAKELMDIHNTIPQATLYRTLNNLVDDDILFVAKEQMVRALIQKVYSVNPELSPNENSIIKENDGSGYFKLFSYFIMSLLKEFQDYSQKESINILMDGSGFQAIPIYASTEELQEIGQQFGNIIRKYQARNTEISSHQKYHLLATIITPPKETEGEIQ